MLCDTMQKRSVNNLRISFRLIGFSINYVRGEKMNYSNSNEKAMKLEALEIARTYIENNEEIPNDLSRILFPPGKREYELTYWGKESREQILSATIPVPLQEDRIFPPNITFNPNEWINKLIFGENSQILKTLIQMKKDGKLKNSDGSDGVRLIYIDPPFATRQEFKVNGEEQVAYADKLSGAAFIEFIRKRLILARELLANDGSIFVHLDNKMVHYIKVVMDEVFGKNNFQREIIWQLSGVSGFKSLAENFVRGHDTILYYSKSNNRIFNKEFLPYSEKQLKRFSSVDEDGRRYKSITKEKRLYLDETKGVPVSDVWQDIASFQTIVNSPEIVNYPTQKPEKLLYRVINSTTNIGDLVLDFFAGSGTTPAVAEKTGRRWIAVDVGKYSIYTIQKRLLQIDNIRPFMLYSGGLYDAEKLNNFDSENWKLFALQLWNCRAVKKDIKGLEFDGEKDNCLVKVYSPQELKTENLKISYETINEIDIILGGNVGNEIFIIAPQGRFTFAEDDVEIKDRIYHILRVPYSLLAKFTENFTPPKQPQDSDSINEIVESVGFDFVQPPYVDFEIAKNTLKIKKFRSNSRMKGELKTELAMVLIDYDYNGEVFDIDDVFYNKDLYETNAKTKKSQLKKAIKIKSIGQKAMFIFVDNAGNEKRMVINGTK